MRAEPTLQSRNSAGSSIEYLERLHYCITFCFNEQCQGELMTPHQLIAELYDTDAVFGEGAACPKLRKMHINPTSFQKMNVSLAMQVSLQTSVVRSISVI